MRNRLFGLMAVALIGTAVVVADAEAARVGGGRNVGRQSNTVQRDAAPQQAPQQGVPAQQQAPAQAAAARPATPPAAAPQPARNRWLGPIAGLAAGLGLAALFSHLGLGAEFANAVMSGLLLVALLAVGLVVFRMIMARRQGGGARPAMAAPGYGSTAIGPEASVSYPPASARSADAVFGGAASTAAATAASVTGLPPGVPADFDVEGFLKGARQQFVRLQAAFDAADQGVLREFVSDDLLPELTRQIAERGAAAQRTDVVSLEAELLGIHPQGLDHVASVRFHGLIREVESAAAEPFDEVWNLVKPIAGGSGWMLAGIQQLA